ncbi:MAG: hypothetical protein JKY65_26125 [Planctomycetes bacterium]|nr:hypothetical protein [Planctomycetota bacterium]
MANKVEKRFLKAIRSSGIVPESDLDRALKVQKLAASRGRSLPIDRVLLKLQILDRDQILGLWRALRYYVWRKEDKRYVKVAVQSGILTPELGAQCLREQKEAYKQDNALVRVNEIARQRGYVEGKEDRALVRALREKYEELTLVPVGDDRAAQPYERGSEKAARKSDGKSWKDSARLNDLVDLQQFVTTSGEGAGVSDEDLDALWEEADLDDVELDSQAIEIARTPLFDDSDESADPLSF